MCSEWQLVRKIGADASKPGLLHHGGKSRKRPWAGGWRAACSACCQVLRRVRSCGRGWWGRPPPPPPPPPAAGSTVVTYASGTGSGTHPDTTALSTKPRCSTQIWQIQNQEIYLSLPDTNPLQTARDESAENIWWQNVCGAVTRRYADEGRLHPPTPRVRSHRNISRIP